MGRNKIGCLVRLIVGSLFALFAVGTGACLWSVAPHFTHPHQSSADVRFDVMAPDQSAEVRFDVIAPHQSADVRFDVMADWLVKTEISTRLDLETEGTPQNRAWNFLATEKIPAFKGDSMTNVNDFISRYVLAVLFYSLNGDEWKSDLNFLSENHHCYWYAVLKLPATDSDNEPMELREWLVMNRME